MMGHVQTCSNFMKCLYIRVIVSLWTKRKQTIQDSAEEQIVEPGPSERT